MNKPLRFLTRTVFGMFVVLFFAVTMIQFVSADELRNNEYNTRTLKNSYKVERGSILVDGDPVAYSTPTGDSFQFLRQYSDGPLFAPVTGYFSHTQGITGVEAAMNQDLSGSSDAQFFSRIMNTITGVDPQGSSVELSISRKVQEAAYNGLTEGGFEGAVVAIEPGTGRILALASTPTFDPNELSTNNDAEIITNYRALEDDPDRPLANRAIAGSLYHPGSVYKLVTVSAALEAEEAKSTSKFDNPAELKLPQSSAVMRNASRSTCGPGDEVSLDRALALSCNIPFAELAMKMDESTIPDMAAAYGFGQELEIPVPVTPSESPVPEDEAQAAIASIGQLDVIATPLQIAMVSAGIANDGEVMKPQLVDRVITPDLRVEREYAPEVFSKPISKGTAQTIGEMMERGVSSSDGAAAGSAIPGVQVAGKTGTAENGEDEAGNPLPYNLWYTGFAPADDPEVAVAVLIADGGGEAYGFEGSSFELPTAIGKQVMEAVLSE
ncbi:peptidoglycan D,D-transpeptidase FtsI family protein [Leucobacter sp. GX24907]